jgi:hypothetical protein
MSTPRGGETPQAARITSFGPLQNPDVLEVLSDPPLEVLRLAGLTIERFLESTDTGGPEAAAAVALELARVVGQRYYNGWHNLG